MTIRFSASPSEGEASPRGSSRKDFDSFHRWSYRASEEKCISGIESGGHDELLMSVKDEKKKKRKRTALIICRDRKQFWTTQAQFWQWVREGVITKTGDSPLTGTFRRPHEELMVVVRNTVLNLAHPNHLREAMAARRASLLRK